MLKIKFCLITLRIFLLNLANSSGDKVLAGEYLSLFMKSRPGQGQFLCGFDTSDEHLLFFWEEFSVFISGSLN